jgi:hypothetical protein
MQKVRNSPYLFLLFAFDELSIKAMIKKELIHYSKS